MPVAPLSRLSRALTKETTGGALLVAAATVALVWANSPWRESYAAASSFVVGPGALHLDLSLSAWAADGLLAVFFFVVGVELKQELVAGSLRRPAEAAVPVLAAVGGMALPALVFVGVVLLADDAASLTGWAIPTATDIAFALAVLAIFGRGLPRAVRVFLLTLAVVDDLLAIVVIAAFYTGSVDLVALALSLVAVVVFALLARSRRASWWMLLPVAGASWYFMHESGVHATIAGVLLGLSIPARRRHGETETRTHRYERLVRPWAAGVALPLFAFFSAGVTVVDGEGIAAVVAQPVVIAIVAGLFAGKLLGVLGVTALVTRTTPLRLPDGILLRDLVPVAMLTGIGFTVSLLIAGLSFDETGPADAAKLAVLAGSLLSATAAAVSLRVAAARRRRASEPDAAAVR
ncbi:Na+/H+ antiporter NhaA [Microbacterium resistens]|uniref:Na+/H+ antiporter NhaA n=1 Tax=Microbacterium resistens TaxID=156977 RepID=UPI001C5933A2|nr:Na+/H+ antiporter NhaA [Microbacterium resistens]MBW1640627.1 Na+/H+ antiporter NhaA [Microbacterium resistens]